MKITLGVTVYNRIEYIKKMCNSLRYTQGLEQCAIRIYDDCSDRFSFEMLEKEFPFVTQYTRRPRNLGSDLNIQQMYKDFLETGDDVLVNCDSDMIFHDEWLLKIIELLPLTDGVLSLYNSALHPPVECLVLNGENVINKGTIGSAGTVFTREMVKLIVDNVKPSFKYDWDWSRHLSFQGVRLLVTEMTYIQHVGILGQNCDASRTIDYGLNFFPNNIETLRLNAAFFEEVISANQEAIKERNKYYYFNFHLPKYKLLSLIIEPLSLLKKKIKFRHFVV